MEEEWGGGDNGEESWSIKNPLPSVNQPQDLPGPVEDDDYENAVDNALSWGEA